MDFQNGGLAANWFLHLTAYFMSFSMITLQNPKTNDFYLSCWQKSSSAVPLLVWRVAMLLCSLGMVTYSMVYYTQDGYLQYWFIYFTHWGLTVMTVAIAFATFISARCYSKGPYGVESGLPWYVKAYWTLFNISVPIAIVVTVLYWVVVYPKLPDKNMVHNVLVHGINVLVVLALLAVSRHPQRLLHCYMPVVFGLCYSLFSVIYYFAGGVNTYGDRWVYSVIYWAKPGISLMWIFITILLIIILYLLTVALAEGRDALAARCTKRSTADNNDGIHLRQPA